MRTPTFSQFMILGLCVAVTGCKSADAGSEGLMVALTSDMQIPKDITHVGVQIITASGETKLERWYELGESPNQQLPGTLGIAPGKSNESVTVRVLSRRDQEIRSVTEAITTVPRDRMAMLRIPIDWLSTGMVESSSASSNDSAAGTGGTSSNSTSAASSDETESLFSSVVSSCSKGKTALLGVCASCTVDESALPDYDPADVFGGGTGTGDGSCFDTVGCFEKTAAMVVEDWDSCSLALESGDDFEPESMALGLYTIDSAGICGSTGCVVPLNLAGAGPLEPGYSIENGQVIVSTAVCDKLKSGQVRGVVASVGCASKTASLPVCGPWSSAGLGAGSDLSALDPLAQCQSFVARVCDNMRRCADGNDFYRKIWQNDASCSERLGYLCDTSLLREEAAPWQEYFTSCGEAFQVTGCEDSLSEVREGCVEPVGKQEAGTSCNFGQCAEGMVCLGAVPNGVGTCTERFVLGAPQQCGTGTVLDLLFPEGACESGLLCEFGTEECRAAGAKGEVCVTDYSCEAGLACVSATCQAALAEGEGCSDDAECAFGLHCIGQDGEGSCRGPGAQGDSCQVVSGDPIASAWEENLCDLTDGLRCNIETWTCAKSSLVGQGNACSPLVSCAGGLCSGVLGDESESAWVCQAYVSDGGSCKQTVQCAPPAECVDGICRLRPAFGVDRTTMSETPGESSCEEGLTSCSGSCVDTTTDTANCGACGTACVEGASCAEGLCSCGADALVCSGICTEVLTDTANCGACGNLCMDGASCLSGVCTCASDREICDTGCVDLSSDEDNCGTCGVECSSGEVCSDGVCTVQSNECVCPTGPLPELNHPRIYASAEFVDCQLFVFGGYSGEDSAKAAVTYIERYDPNQGKWLDVGTMETPRAGMASGVVTGTIWLVAGHDPTSNTMVDTTDGFAPTTSSWTSGQPTASAMGNLTSVVVGSELLIFGGYSSSGVLSSVSAYAPGNDTWRNGTAMTLARDRAAAAAIEGVVYVSGGQAYGSNQYSTVAAYDVAADTWTEAPSLLEARSNHAMEALNGKVYVLAGSNSGGANPLESVEVLTPGESAWQVATALTGGARDMLGSAACGGSIYLVGGRVDGLPVGTVEVYVP